MSCTFPVAVSQLCHEDSREGQIERAINWILKQPGGPVVVVTPKKQFESKALKRLLDSPGLTHMSWRGLSKAALEHRRVIYAWPNRQHLNDLWDVEVDALVVIEWGEAETVEWIEVSNPVRLLRNQTVQPSSDSEQNENTSPLPDDVDQILEYIADHAAGYHNGLKWNEEEKLKADMMNCPKRWEQVTVEQVRNKCRALNMRPKDIDTIASYLQRRKEGRVFNVRSTYRVFRFN